MPKISIGPRCSSDKCHHNIGGHCKLLTERTRTKPCPFFKTPEEVEEGRDEAHERLVRLGRYDLIETYETNPERRGVW